MEMEKMLDEMAEAMRIAKEVRERTSKWSCPSFLALIGVLVDRRASDDGADAMEMWDELYSVAVDINKTLGPMS